MLFVGLIVAAQFMFRYIERDMHQGEQVEWYMHYVPGITYALLILIFGSIYKKIAIKLVQTENHRYGSSLENSMINKVYIFQFVNTYISNFFYIFFFQDFKHL